MRKLPDLMRRAVLAVARVQNLSDVLNLRDVFVFSGLAAVGYGVAQVSVPAAWVVVGGIVFLLGVRR
jgi:hypothetical protein